MNITLIEKRWIIKLLRLLASEPDMFSEVEDLFWREGALMSQRGV